MLKNKRRFAVESLSSPRILLPVTLAIVLCSLGGSPRTTTASHNPRLVISEVYPNTLEVGSSIETNEWIEIRNLESHRVNLSGWIVEDAQAIAHLPDFDLGPRAAVLVVGRNAEMAVPPGSTLIVLDSPAIGTGLRDSGDRVALVSPYGIRYDAVSWGDVRSPQFMEPPEPSQSITRTAHGHQRVSEELTPWTAPQTISAQPHRHEHPRPDTKLRITAALIDPPEGEAESVTVRNFGDEPVLTINWTLTAGSSLVKLRSVRILPGDSHVIRQPGGRIGSGLARNGGHLVLRDQHGNWLATGSWGDDHTFHRQPAPDPGLELRFNPLARTHPRIPWHEPLFGPFRYHLAAADLESCQFCASNIAYRMLIEQPEPIPKQDVPHDAPSVWISEVYPNAGRGREDARFEWFEITNWSDAEIDLTEWTIEDNTSSDPLDGLVAPARSSVVVGVSGDGLESVIPIVSDGRIGNGLANAGDRLTLIDPDGIVVSSISWGNDRTYSNVKAPDETRSIQRTSPEGMPTVGAPTPGDAPTDASSIHSQEEQATNSHAEAGSTEAAEEAEPSSVQDSALTYQVSITEILPAPLAGQPEWIEIANASDRPIDLGGWSVGDLASRTELSGTLPAGGRLVIGSLPLDSDVPVLVVERIGNGLNNNGDTVVLFDQDGREVDRVSYGTDELAAPGRGLSVALDPSRWVVTARPSPGTSEVLPLLEDSFRAAAIRQPVSDEGRLPVVQSPPDDGVNAWMIVSFALIGVILTLSLRRWQPSPEPEDAPAEPAEYTGAPQQPEPELELERDSENPRQ